MLKSNISNINKMSKRELERQYKEARTKVAELLNGNKSLKNLVSFLSIRLYINDPADEIFTNGSFKEGFLEEVKKGAKKTLEKIKDKSE